MSRFIFVAAAMAFATPAVLAAPVPPDGKGAYFPFPAKAPIVFCLNGYDNARARLTKMLTTALPDEAPKLSKQLDEEIEKLLEGRKLSAVRKDARVFVAVGDLADILEGPPPLAVLVPVTSYQEFRETFLTKDELRTLDKGRDGVDIIKTAAFGDEMPAYLVDLKDYVALTVDKTTADVYAAKYAPGTIDIMGAELGESFLKGDVSVYVNMDSINERFGDQIRAFKGLIDFGLQQAQQQGMLPGLNKKQMESLQVILKGAFQGVEDCRAIVLVGEFRPEGLVVRLQARFAENSLSAKMIALENPTAMADLARLPAGLGVYSGMRFGITISELIRNMSQDFATTEDDARGAALIETHLKDLTAAQNQGEVTASAIPGVAMVVSNYKEPEKAAKALSKLYKAIAPGGRVQSVVLKAAPRVQDEAETHRGFTLSSVLLKFDFEATAAAFPEQIKEGMLETFKRTMNEQTTMWIGTNGKVLVQLTAKDWNAAQAMLDKYLDGASTLGADAGFKLTRANLPADANLLMVAETSSALNQIIDSIRSAGEAIPGLPRLGPLKAAKGPPTFVGLAITLKGDIATVTAFVPTGAIAVGRKVLDPFFKNIE
jgi:hypothetical protein